MQSMTDDLKKLVKTLRKNRPRKGNEKPQPKCKLANVDQRHLGRYK